MKRRTWRSSPWRVHSFEISVSLLRLFLWIVLGVVLLATPAVSLLGFDQQKLFGLLIFGICFNIFAQISIHFTAQGSVPYRMATKGGIIFGYIATLWLIQATGAEESPFFPLTYLLVLHGAIYWRYLGSVMLTLAIFVGYTLLLAADGYAFSGASLLRYIIQIILLLTMLFFGMNLAIRERGHRDEKSLYREQMNHDYLTNLYNHRHFQDQLQQRIDRQHPFCLVLADIDHFKKINDTYGHLTGDRILKAIAAILLDKLPPNRGGVFRYGGEEFAILLDLSTKTSVQKFVGEVIDELNQKTFHVDGVDLKVTLSFGIERYHAEDEKDQLILRADNLLYSAKKKGRNQALFSERFDE